ncbi:DUF6415 family natural product biosynthesis protein [Streptomyces sp. NPDC053560]|uniref:DUF6415 family natural product biosynthesis protein n=1 Tax=Streptomyces sp. NPDC053560 TaxID=3365711 RepID=UPI0037D442AE
MTTGEPRGRTAVEQDVDSLPIDKERIRHTLMRVRNSRLQRADALTLAELEQMLRGHIGLLLLDVREAVDRLWRGSTDWNGRATRLDLIEHQLRHGLGRGPLADQIQVRTLAHDCEWLLTEHEEAQR